MIKTTVQSETQIGKIYQIILTENGWHCDCPAYVFSKKNPRTCKHIADAYRKLEEKLKQPAL